MDTTKFSSAKYFSCSEKVRILCAGLEPGEKAAARRYLDEMDRIFTNKDLLVVDLLADFELREQA